MGAFASRSLHHGWCWDERLPEPDLAYERSPGVREALAALRAKAPAVMVIGRAGTGKTRLVHYLRRRPGSERQVILAPTGIAALNAWGQTIHSFFKLRLGVIDAKQLTAMSRLEHFFDKIERVIIDEISMVRADLLDAVDQSLRLNRKNDQPFGGV